LRTWANFPPFKQKAAMKRSSMGDDTPMAVYVEPDSSIDRITFRQKFAQVTTSRRSSITLREIMSCLWKTCIGVERIFEETPKAWPIVLLCLRQYCHQRKYSRLLLWMIHRFRVWYVLDTYISKAQKMMSLEQALKTCSGKQKKKLKCAVLLLVLSDLVILRKVITDLRQCQVALFHHHLTKVGLRCVF